MATLNGCEFFAMSLCIITPSLPPAIDGVGDYCRMFFAHWNKDNIPDLRPQFAQLSFLVHEGRQEACTLPGASVDRFSAGSLGSALKKNGADQVLLQYVGYGYDFNGVPSWLCDALEQWLSASSERKLHVMFHETWASGPPWKREFWSQSHQRRCALRLLSMASNAVASNHAGLAQLHSLKQPLPVSLINIGSNFQLPEALPAKNFKRFLAIGRQGSRLRTVKRHLELMRFLHAQQLIDELVLAGESIDRDDPSSFILSSIAGLPVTHAYNFPFDKIPEIVLSAGVSLMHTDTSWILKSGSFQFAVSLAQVPVALFDGPTEDPVDGQRHVIGYKTGFSSEIVLQFAGENLSRLSNNLSELSDRFSWPSIVRQWHALLANPAR